MSTKAELVSIQALSPVSSFGSEEGGVAAGDAELTGVLPWDGLSPARANAGAQSATPITALAARTAAYTELDSFMLRTFLRTRTTTLPTEKSAAHPGGLRQAGNRRRAGCAGRGLSQVAGDGCNQRAKPGIAIQGANLCCWHEVGYVATDYLKCNCGPMPECLEVAQTMMGE
jgi:hypothetical protein